MRMHKVFTYGTLMRGQVNHDAYLEGIPCLGMGKVEGYLMYDLGWYPGIVPGEGTILGEVYEVDDAGLDDLDYLEDEGNLYIRKEVSVRMETGQTLTAWIYEYYGVVRGFEQIPEECQPYSPDWRDQLS